MSAKERVEHKKLNHTAAAALNGLGLASIDSAGLDWVLLGSTEI